MFAEIQRNYADQRELPRFGDFGVITLAPPYDTVATQLWPKYEGVYDVG